MKRHTIRIAVFMRTKNDLAMSLLIAGGFDYAVSGFTKAI